MKPTLGETVVALFAGLVAAVLAGVMGGIAAIFACTRLLTGEEGEGALILGPATALVFAALAFVFTLRWVLRYGDSPTQTPQ
jgi:hypothetical protein